MATEQFGLKDDVIDEIRAVFARFKQIRIATLYGSRAKGNYKPGSDIDLALTTEGDVSIGFLHDVAIALDDLDLPYSFDVSLRHHINNPNLLDHIQRIGIVFYDAQRHKVRGVRTDP